MNAGDNSAPWSNAGLLRLWICWQPWLREIVEDKSNLRTVLRTSPRNAIGNRSSTDEENSQADRRICIARLCLEGSGRRHIQFRSKVGVVPTAGKHSKPKRDQPDSRCLGRLCKELYLSPTALTLTLFSWCWKLLPNQWRIFSSRFSDWLNDSVDVTS